jgi:hypothetical protein
MILGRRRSVTAQDIVGGGDNGGSRKKDSGMVWYEIKADVAGWRGGVDRLGQITKLELEITRSSLRERAYF